MIHLLWIIVQQFLKKLTIELSYNQQSTPSYTLMRVENIYPCKKLYLNGHSSIIHSSQQIVTAQISVDY